MIAFARTCAAIAATASKLEKIALVAGYLRELGDDDLAPATRYFTGNPFPQAQERSLAVGGRTIVEAAETTWGVDDAALGVAYRATGDLGAALGPFVRPSHDLGLFRETLTPARLYALLVEIADASGKSAQKRRRILCERIFSACTDPLEATYIVKIMTGELRIGLREGLVVDAIAQAFERDPRAVRRAASAAGDLGAVALAAKHDALDQVTIAYHAPIAFMLASPIAYGSEYKDLAAASWLVEDKYDGIRAQAHVTPNRVSLYSRTLNDVAASYPEVVEALRALPGSFALDGEIVAVRDGRVLPFRFLQARLQRKEVGAELMREVPVRYVVFDALARDDEFLLDHPLAERRMRLAELLAGGRESDAVTLAPWTALEPGASAEAIHERFEESRARGDEGLVFKRTDSPYTPGRRGKSWLKLKRELATLDCVVVGVERGHGKRVNVLSDYTFAVRDVLRQAQDDYELAVIGKAYSGLTDVEFAEMTQWFEDHRLPAAEARAAYRRLDLKRHEIVVEPSVVVEIAFDIIQKSDLHKSGYALRFPRIVRLRPDKRAEDADTLQRVEEIYAEMLDREGIPVER
ncbi:MAG TPA: ATP-dependent DNA ligase [Candidatus Limnocylindrales bacterium]|nr:ATP-dependent DNA ligase [Candidatus Limnocylindrales bacterium]